jgi:hypothetical protein
MSTISRKPITAPIWVKFAIAASGAVVLTLIAFLLTTDTSGAVGGKASVMGAFLVLPLVWVTKFEWSASMSFAFAFVTYLVICFCAVWFSTREKRSV